uniref:DNA-directed RNA polymerase n=1 Tax=Heterorhabditis bacteriophora TaxID=37862 RepID=A0A1I7X852_HETBA
MCHILNRASAIAARDPELVRAMCLAHTYDGQVFLRNISYGIEVTTNRSIIDSLSSFDHIDLLEVHKNAHQKVEDLFLSCEFGKTGSCQDDIHPILTPHGLCFAVSPNMTVRRPGPEATLSLLLNLEVYEIIPGTVVDPGVILSIYDKNDALSQQFTEGIHLEAGKVVTIPINEVRKLSRFHHYCGRRIADPFSKDEYSLAACQWANIMDEIEKKCKCRPVNSPHNRIFIAGHKESYMLNVKDKPRRQVRTCTLRQELNCVHNYTEARMTNFQSYLKRSFSREINSTAAAIGLRLTNDASLIALSLLQLGLMESQLAQPQGIFGLRLMDTATKQSIIDFVLPFIQKMRQCIIELHDKPDKPNEIAHRCRKIFTDNYNVLVDAKTVYTFIDPSSIEFQEYEESANRISSVLRNIIYLKRVKVLDWHNHEINLKEFEMLYREGGKDNTEIHDLMKLRKLMLTDLIETKSPFVRGEWLTRIQRQVEIAQSYSATPQYDQSVVLGYLYFISLFLEANHKCPSEAHFVI